MHSSFLLGFSIKRDFNFVKAIVGKSKGQNNFSISKITYLGCNCYPVAKDWTEGP